MKKYIVICIIILFILLAFTPYIKAFYVSNIEKTHTETSSQGFDLVIVDIVPYIWKEEKGLLGELHLTLEIKNIGDAPTNKVVKYDGNSTYFISNRNYSRAWGALLMGSLEPGETWIPKSSAGLIFLNIIPRIFNIEYEVTPTDSNPDNNYIRQVYLVRGGGIFPFWKHIPAFE
jgi:hypothetical protein